MKKQKNQEQIDYKNLLQRTLADFENYKKRVEADRLGWTMDGKIEMLEQILPVLDNLHLTTANAPKELEGNSWVQGILIVIKHLEETISSLGIEKIMPEAGIEFDPRLHEAIRAEKNPKFKSHQIITIVRPGYKMADKIIRVAQVVVAE